jgi:hypothetical protein
MWKSCEKSLAHEGALTLYECKVSWNKIVKGIKNFVFKGFGVVYVKFMVGKWCGIIVVHRQ